MAQIFFSSQTSLTKFPEAFTDMKYLFTPNHKLELQVNDVGISVENTIENQEN